MLPLFAAMLVGDAVLFAFGFCLAADVVANIIVQSGAALPGWLDANNLLGSAFDGAVKPFVLWDVLKMAFAAVTVAGTYMLVSKKD